MNSYFILWLCSILGKLSTFFCVIGVIYLTVTLIASVAYHIDSSCDMEWNESPMRNFAKRPFRHFVISSVMLFLSCLIPSTSQCYAIFGVGTTIEYLKDSKEAQKLPENAFKALNYYLESISEKESK